MPGSFQHYQRDARIAIAITETRAALADNPAIGHVIFATFGDAVTAAYDAALATTGGRHQ